MLTALRSQRIVALLLDKRKFSAFVKPLNEQFGNRGQSGETVGCRGF